MSRPHDAIAIAFAAAAMILIWAGHPWAQEAAPDPAMLLHLDLFTARSGKADGGGGGSMFEQIRTLRAMGYLNGGDVQATPAPHPEKTNNVTHSDRNAVTPSNTLDLGDGQ